MGNARVNLKQTKHWRKHYCVFNNNVKFITEKFSVENIKPFAKYLLDLLFFVVINSMCDLIFSLRFAP